VSGSSSVIIGWSIVWGRGSRVGGVRGMDNRSVLNPRIDRNRWAFSFTAPRTSRASTGFHSRSVEFLVVPTPTRSVRKSLRATRIVAWQPAFLTDQASVHLGITGEDKKPTGHYQYGSQLPLVGLREMRNQHSDRHIL
jgi:hypothetical protein